MNPRLVIFEGNRQKKTVELEIGNDSSFTIGRDLECDLQIRSIAVSRRHCRIYRVADSYKIEDLKSHNGTFINDVPISSSWLNEGDRIRIGESYMIFLTKEDVSDNQMPLTIDDGSLTLKSAVRLFPYLDTAELTSDLNILVKLGKVLNEIKNPQSLEQSFLEIILEFIPARRGVILLTESGLDEAQTISTVNREDSDVNFAPLSRTVCRQILAEQTALVSNDLSLSSAASSESLIASRATSVLCVPLNTEEKKGLIYLDATDPKIKFTENHLQQMTALSFLISAAISNAESAESLWQENQRLKAELDIETNMIGESRAIREVFHLISRVASSDSTVLIDGESGTGKELVAKAIHRNSLRRDKPFTAFNCAVFNENLLESELFGYEKGAFTGAFAPKKGKLELSEGGTLFLDEIGELAPVIQAKLLRVLQEREFERVGGSRPVKVDVRVIAATNRSLEEEIKKGNFREDLFFRLNVVRIKMPSLRDRKSDIPLLAQYFIQKFGEKCGRKVVGLSPRVRKILLAYDWRGNVRELGNVIERAIVLGTTETILPEDLPEEIVGSITFSETENAGFHEQLKTAKQKIVLDALENSNWNYTNAARLLGIHPNNLHRLIRNLNIKISK